ncbi:hypothetical protein KAFR_0K01780 [Kazachstania africana CBS 2517]|uniref:Altered inheritance of mitochondria protein 11 n=1 Tax=Kazachstania africana (strain ATCC 22294 / BCRC 22015 / CBS 2517 / CECT 1963 / NBRC 1671 / NRRL Y-8276) TaxID=1071382 RepID=H2B1N2_KAZAF|nr:hypothetical protein KAFR_0K01780 [Kazachstania africana CBS 2517]CCF60532.1 hypothetical protein KAFR_0K01780 [Kazachstania africana CBS 2517]
MDNHVKEDELRGPISLYDARRKNQMFKFVAATAFTLFFSRLTSRTLSSLKYKPKLFDFNAPPSTQSYNGEAGKALFLSSGITTGIFSMAITGFAWVFDVSTLPEFNATMRNLFGNRTLIEDPNEQLPMDDDTAQVVQEFTNIFKK